MIILSIETSCDETAVCIMKAEGDINSPLFKILGNALFSQIDIHKEFGGVYPMLAKREHAKNLPPIIKKVLVDSSFYKKIITQYSEKKWEEVKTICSREEGLYEKLREVLENIEAPNLDAISVTSGPGLAPALWVGISCAQALSKLWGVPLVGINHMEGHICSVLLNRTDEFQISNDKLENNTIRFPAIALLISGGHTELVQIEGWGKYKVIGQTRDDAVGESFDKVARMLGLPYPGGPEISKLAVQARKEKTIKGENEISLPRPMIHSKDLDFSFSGLKTAVLYSIRDHTPLSEKTKRKLAREFEDSVIEVLVTKTKTALDQNYAKTLIIAGGVIANKTLRQSFMEFENEYNELTVKIPEPTLSTDNAIMIACATYINILTYPELLSIPKKIVANGNLKLSH